MKLIIDIPDEGYDWIKNGFPDNEDKEFLLKAVANGTPYNPSGDAISREALKEQIKNTDFDFGDYYDNTEEIRKRVCEAINNAPTVEQFDDTELQRAIGYADGYSKGREERPQGEWVCITKGNVINTYKCSLCGHRITCTEGAMKQHKGCHCGAQMKGDAK